MKQSKDRFVRQQESKVKEWNLPPRVCRSGSIQVNTLVGSGLFLLPAVFLNERKIVIYLPRSSQLLHTSYMHGCMRAQVKRDIHERFEHLYDDCSLESCT
mmetsp:Transcript_82/g.170  ORF Transcript_82/g.170 Transcript_82/m.170 type:complete len:100 (-) Transcript_82:958-1257(-)